MIRPYTVRIWFLVLVGILLGFHGFEAHAAEHTLTFDINGTRFYVPKVWTISAPRSDPSYNASLPITADLVFKADRGILLRFSDLSTPSSQRYPEITFPFPYEIVIDVAPRDAPRPQRVDRKTADPNRTNQLADRPIDADGFVKLGMQRYIAALPGDDNGFGGYLEFTCRAGLTEADNGISRRCTVYTYVLDVISVRTSFDGALFTKPHWRHVPKQADALVKWLVTQPDERSEKINIDISGANQ